jgi:hypothetical protein
MPLTSNKVALIAAIALSLASAAVAKDVALPKIDLQKLCRASQIDLQAEGTSAQGSIDSCVADEKEAHDQIIKDWASYAASDRARCIQPGLYLPSYVEWLTCVQTARDVRKLRVDQPAETAAGVGASTGVRRSGVPGSRCPVVHYREDASIDWVLAC